MENLKILSSAQGFSKHSASVQNRKTSSFIFRTSGSMLYNFDDFDIKNHAGELIFLPQGSSYTFKTLSDEDAGYTSISFQADFVDPKPTIFSLENFPETNYICNHFPTMWNLGSQSEKYQCFSLFYSLLSYISNIENMSYSDKKKLKIIDPAVEHLKRHIFDSSLMVDTLHTLCGISDTYFRKIFIARFGTSPQKYIVNKRISQAKSMLEAGDFDTISEISASVGYNDPLHFSRAFKKKYGIAPSKLNL